MAPSIHADHRHPSNHHDHHHHHHQPRSAAGPRPAFKKRVPTTPPIIKIVHVHAPRLVRTDVAHFRALVQEMTGQLSSSDASPTPGEDDPPASTFCAAQIHRQQAADCGVDCAGGRRPQPQPRRGGAECSGGCMAAPRGTEQECHRGGRAARPSSLPRSMEREDGYFAEDDEEDDDDEEEVDEEDVCDNMATSLIISSMGGASQRHGHAVDSFFADHEYSGHDGHETKTETCGYPNHCSAYVTLGRGSAQHELPGGFDHFPLFPSF